MKLTVCIFLILTCGCAAELPVLQVHKPASTADYTIVVQVLDGYSCAAVAAASSASGMVQMEELDRDTSPFHIQTLRFRFEQVRPKDMTRLQQRLGRCRGVISTIIANERTYEK